MEFSLHRIATLNMYSFWKFAHILMRPEDDSIGANNGMKDPRARMGSAGWGKPWMVTKNVVERNPD